MKIVYTYLVMDLIHAGHILYMKNAKALAGKDGLLVVGILTDEATLEKKPKPPILSLEERIQIADAIKYVDMVVAQDTYSPLDNVINIKPDILVESESHDEEDTRFMEAELETLNIHTKIIKLPYYPCQSSTEIKNKIKEN